MYKHWLLYITLMLSMLHVMAHGNVDTLIQTNVKSKVVRTRTNTDTVIPKEHIEAWQYTSTNQTVKTTIDTAAIKFQYYDPAKSAALYNISLGEPGQPVLEINFAERTKDQNLHWTIENFKPYIVTHNHVGFYNTKSPYTRLFYITGNNKYQQFHFIHTQNVNRNINIGLRYNIFTTEGFLVSQKARNRLGSFWIDIQKYRYRNHTAVNTHSIKADNNGGLTDIRYLLDSTNIEALRLPTRLVNSGSYIRLFNGHLSHEIAAIQINKEDPIFEIGPKHEMTYYMTRRKYFDQTQTTYTNGFTNITTDYFSNRYNNTKTRDTITIRQLTNNAGLFLKIGRDNHLRFEAMLRNSNEQYKNHFSDTLFAYRNDTLINTYYTMYRLSGKALNNKLTFSAQLYNSISKGYKKNEYRHNIDITYNHTFIGDTALINLNYEASSIAPDYFMQNYYSNHYKWRNRWAYRQNTTAQLQWQIPKYQFKIFLQSSNIKNHLWLDQQRKWRINPKSIEVSGGGVEKTQTLGRHISIRAAILYQNTNDTIIDIPKISASGTLLLSTPLHFKSTGGVANLNLGIDCWIYSKYYMPNYDPALNMFFMQRDKKLGNYPFIDIFASVHIKRMVLLVRLEHLTTLYTKSTYFNAYGYPVRPFNVQFGISWTFYD